MNAQSPLAVTMGDPAGCGPAITRAAWAALRREGGRPFFLVGAASAFQGADDIRPIETPGDAAAVFPEALPLLPIAADMPAPNPGHPDPATAQAIIQSIETAVALTLEGAAAAVVTNPISKALLYDAGFRHPGHTEFLAALSARPDRPEPKPVMMLVGGGLRVALATIHAPLIDAAKSLSQDGLTAIGRITAQAVDRDFGLAAPRLAFTGLNPHAGEGGALGCEEIEIINPAAATLRAEGIDMSDARPADTVFAEALDGRFDAVIAMTHDQGLIPVKTLDFWGGVNVTLGLPIIRTSPDHGVAYDAAAKGAARPDSLIAAIRLADSLAARRMDAA
ncbi:MAG: 4-hydroxythreonine-4-phosphate dehydrogenase PdxA [Pseudomonadota bacterium]